MLETSKIDIKTQYKNQLQPSNYTDSLLCPMCGVDSETISLCETMSGVFRPQKQILRISL